jgi:2-polyprenyl-3-methyl-5-hydroxy-6-metoxy-1,4-benzoquinol methylase
MPDFSTRSDDVEIMDDLACSGEVVHQTLREIENINRLLGGNYVTVDGVARLVGAVHGAQSTVHGPPSMVQPPSLETRFGGRGGREVILNVTDLGCGGGDLLKLIRRWALKKGVDLSYTGIDANPNIVAYAQRHTSGAPAIAFETVDIFSDEFKQRKFDIVTGTLFFHHFSSDQLVSFFHQLKQQTSVGIVINDIHRHWFAYYSIKWLTQIFSKSSMVKFDAPLSVLRAFRKSDLQEIMRRAGIEHYTLRWMWAFRWQVVIELRTAGRELRD